VKITWLLELDVEDGYGLDPETIDELDDKLEDALIREIFTRSSSWTLDVCHEVEL
jgi:hypothetical protein